jgi:hypothetical protein
MKKTTRDYPKRYAGGGPVRGDENKMPILEPGGGPRGWMITTPAQAQVDFLEELKDPELQKRWNVHTLEERKRHARESAVGLGQDYGTLPKNLENYQGMRKGGPVRKRK